MHAHGHRLSAALATTVAVLATFGVLLAGAPAGATHDATAWSFYTTAGGGGVGDANHQQFPSVLTDRAGFVYVFYHDWNQPTGNSNVYVTNITTGGPFGLPQIVFNRLVNPTLPNAVRRTNAFGVNWPPAAAMDHSGNLYVAWSHTGLDVYVSKSSDGGNAWGASVMVSNPANNNYAPAVTVTTDDDVWVAWYEVEPSTGRANVTIARSTDLGATFGSPVDATGPFPGTAVLRWHDLASDAAGRVYVAYMSDVIGAEAHVNLTWSDDGVTWSAPSRVDGATWAGYPKLTVDAQDRLHMGWFDQRSTPSGSLTFWYRRSDDRGATWTLEVPVNQGTTSISNVIADIAVYADVTVFGWNGNLGGSGMGYGLSADGGDLWYPEAFADPRVGGLAPTIDADENGTFYAAFYHWNEFLNNYDVGMMFYDAPPSEPVITFIVRGATSLTVQWTASPEPDVSMYRLWRSQDGSSYALVASVAASTTSYQDAGLAPGTYWYRVTAADWRGTSSHPSVPVASTVGMTVDERFDAVQAQIDALEAALALAQGDIDGLLTNVDDLTRLVGVVRSEQATAAMSTLILILLVIVLILLILLLVRSRRPGPPQAMPPTASPPGQGPPSAREPPRPPEGSDVDDL
ncbi:MAG: hypothetical protein ACT4OI_09875 [Methanobacteriota archaeon]